MNKTEADILENALAKLKSITQEVINDNPDRYEVQEGIEGYGAYIEVSQKRVFIEVKNEVRPQNLNRMIALKQNVKTLLVAANYITPTAKELLKENGINYVDAAGNIFFRLGQIYIHIEGMPNVPDSQKLKGKEFAKTGIKVIFHFLLDPVLVNATYRDIAARAGVALGSVPKIMESLQQEGFLLKKTAKTWMLNDIEKLVERWQTSYNSKLKPGLLLGRFRFSGNNNGQNWQDIALKPGAEWGGEPGADLLTHYLKPEVYTLYSNQPKNDVIKSYHWLPDDAGDIYVYRKFWNNEDKAAPQAPALILYADLLDSGNARCIETANVLYERYIQKG